MIFRSIFNFLFLDMILIFYRIAPNRLNFADKCHGYKAKSCVSVVRCASVAGQVQPHSVGGPLTLCCRACFLLFAPRDPRIGTDLCAHYKQLHGQASWELATGNRHQFHWHFCANLQTRPHPQPHIHSHIHFDNYFGR